MRTPLFTGEFNEGVIHQQYREVKATERPVPHRRTMPGRKAITQREIRGKTHATRHNPVPGIVPIMPLPA